MIKLKVDMNRKSFLREMRARLEGHDLRVGILRNKAHLPAASKAEGLTSVLGGPARKTQRGRLNEINAELRKMRTQAAGARSRARKLRSVAKALKGQGFARTAKATTRQALAQSRRGRAISAKAKALRATKRKPSAPRITLRDVLQYSQRATGVNILRRPFWSASSAEYKRFLAAYIKTAAKGGDMRRVEALLTDVVVQPVLRKQYGPNTSAARRKKGFDRLFIDTGQMIRGMGSRIRARRKST